VLFELVLLDLSLFVFHVISCLADAHRACSVPRSFNRTRARVFHPASAIHRFSARDSEVPRRCRVPHRWPCCRTHTRHQPMQRFAAGWRRGVSDSSGHIVTSTCVVSRADGSTRSHPSHPATSSLPLVEDRPPRERPRNDTTLRDQRC